MSLLVNPASSQSPSAATRLPGPDRIEARIPSRPSRQESCASRVSLGLQDRRRHIPAGLTFAPDFRDQVLEDIDDQALFDSLDILVVLYQDDGATLTNDERMMEPVVGVVHVQARHLAELLH